MECKDPWTVEWNGINTFRALSVVRPDELVVADLRIGLADLGPGLDADAVADAHAADGGSRSDAAGDPGEPAHHGARENLGAVSRLDARGHAGPVGNGSRGCDGGIKEARQEQKEQRKNPFSWRRNSIV